jgi:Family of unknown function (DUF5690)
MSDLAGERAGGAERGELRVRALVHRAIEVGRIRAQPADLRMMREDDLARLAVGVTDRRGLHRLLKPAVHAPQDHPGPSVWLLGQLPPPSPADEALRVRRAPMDAAERGAFLAVYWPGVTLLTAAYILLTAFRDFRDNFAAEVWTALGYGKESAVFTQSELPVAAIALVALAAVMAVRDNLKALMVIHGIIVVGFLVMGASAWAFEAHLISPLAFMIAAGAGLYMAYTPFNAMLFDRLVAFSGRVATAGFLIYVADASGYLGSVALLVWRNFGVVKMDWLRFFILSAYATSAVGAVLSAAAAIYFLRRSQSAAPLRDITPTSNLANVA